MYSVAATSTPVGVASRPTSAKKARTATVVRATKDSKSEPEESGFWRKVFLPDGKEEVKADMREMQQLGIEGIPVMIFDVLSNGRGDPLRGALPSVRHDGSGKVADYVATLEGLTDGEIARVSSGLLGGD